MQSEIFDVTLCNRIEGRGQYQLLGKTATHFFHFYLLIPPLKWTFIFLYIPPTPLYYKPPPCPPSLPPSFLINHNFSWKSKLKHTSVDITCFFEGANSSLTNHKKYLLETFHRTSETSKLELFAEKVNWLCPKTIFAKISTLNVWKILK